MLAWLFGLLFNLYLIYMAYSFPPLALWLWMGIVPITAILLFTAKDRITGNNEKSIEERRAIWSKYAMRDKDQRSVKKKKRKKKKKY